MNGTPTYDRDSLAQLLKSFPGMSTERVERYLSAEPEDNVDEANATDHATDDLASSTPWRRNAADQASMPPATHDNPDDLIERIVTYRRSLALTQRELAQRLGVSARTLEEWEQRRRSPRGPARALLARWVQDGG